MYYEYEYNLISPILIPSGDAAAGCYARPTPPWTPTVTTPEAPIQVDKVNKEHIEWVTMGFGWVGAGGGTVAKFISANLSSCKNFCDSNLDKIRMLQEREFVVLFSQ